MADELRIFRFFGNCPILLIIPVLLQATKAPLYTEQDFISQVPDVPHFVMFFAPWCSHCQRLMPLWDKLSATYGKHNSRILAAKVDCTKETPLCAREDIKAYPTLRFFNDGERKTYRGNRDVEEFLKFSGLQVVVPDENKEELVVEMGGYKFEKEIQTGLHFVNFYAPWCKYCKKLAPEWQQLAEDMRFNNDIKILKVNCDANKEICNANGIKAYPTLIVFHQGMQAVHYKGERTLADLQKFTAEVIDKYVISIGDTVDAEFANEAETPVAGHNEVITLSRDTFDMAVQSGKTFVYFFAPWCKYCKEFTPVWEKLAKMVIEKGLMIKIAKIDCTKEKRLCENLKMFFVHLFHLGYHPKESFYSMLDRDQYCFGCSILLENAISTVGDTINIYEVVQYFGEDDISILEDVQCYVGDTINKGYSALQMDTTCTLIDTINNLGGSDITVGNTNSSLKISAYPSIVLFKSKFSYQDYKGNREINELFNFLKKHEHEEL